MSRARASMALPTALPIEPGELSMFVNAGEGVSKNKTAPSAARTTSRRHLRRRDRDGLRHRRGDLGAEVAG